tara:strand:+ start:68 stop:451 length:384 start_codon:yes stop_codon:yes gene_type:complete
MAYPTGSGSEILARTTIGAQSSTATSFRWDGTMATLGTSSYTVPALHIITVLNIIACSQASVTEYINIRLNDGVSNKYILDSAAIGGRQTFVFSDKLVLIGGDKLEVFTDAATDIHFICNYIDQDWT